MASVVIRWTCILVLTIPVTASAEDEKSKLHSVTVRDIELQVPASWKPVKATSRFRVAQFEIPDKSNHRESAELVVYYFGGPTGGIQANIERWIDQFYNKDRKVKMISGKCHDGSYVLADIEGTWKKPYGPPIAQKTVDKPGSRVIGVVLITEKEKMKDYYFVKLSGPDDLVQSQATALRRAIGADVESEKPFKLEDAEN